VGDYEAEQFVLFRATAASAPLTPGIYLYGPVRFEQAPTTP